MEALQREEKRSGAHVILLQNSSAHSDGTAYLSWSQAPEWDLDVIDESTPKPESPEACYPGRIERKFCSDTHY